MELLRLRYFEYVAKYESITKAAEELHISQPSLSNSIIRLEKEFGAPLFERKNRKCVSPITEAMSSTTCTRS
ncbi:MAG: LysR family transcriptional regulator [Butyricicoccus sp.]|nr:LysR family transcriptional regulator [Butyricicoccus sp.]